MDMSSPRHIYVTYEFAFKAPQLVNPDNEDLWFNFDYTLIRTEFLLSWYLIDVNLSVFVTCQGFMKYAI